MTCIDLFDKIDFSKISEDTTHTFSLNKEENKEQRSTWSKSVTYDNNFYETGSLARAKIGRAHV